MNLVSDNDLKKIQLDLLKEFDKVCRKLNLKYTLFYGTMLGAIRHQGFIPWDDDIDVAMKRSEYNIFIEYCKNNETIFNLFSTENTNKYPYLFAKITNKDTILEEKNCNRRKIPYGAFIDIFPLDSCGKDMHEALKFNKKIYLKKVMLVSANWKKFFINKNKNWYTQFFRFGFFLMSRFINENRLQKRVLRIIERYDSDNSKYVISIGGSYGKKEIVESSLFDEYIEVDFEQHKFYCIKEYDKYLSHTYGDYMQLPPMEKRVARHDFDVYYK